MIKHVVMWKFKEEAEGRSKGENIALFKQKLENLVGIIPEIRFLEVGTNFNTSEAAYDVVLITEFENEQDLKTYTVHPEHVKVSDFCQGVRQERAVVDYTI